MNIRTLRADAQSVLLMAYGGHLKHDEMGFTEAQAATWLAEERDAELREEIKAKHDSFQPNPEYYTLYDEVEIKWATRKEMHYIDLPRGNPPAIVHGRGITISPVKGGGAMFLYTPYDFCNGNPRYAWMEGNWSWEANGDGKVWFTNMPYGAVRFVTLRVIETGKADLDAPSNIPGDIFAACRDRVIERMGLGRPDNSTDNIDQRTSGGPRR